MQRRITSMAIATTFVASTLLIAAQQDRQMPTPTEAPHQISEAGLVPPKVITSARPGYTAEAMRARIEGSVVLECIVGTDGLVKDAKVTRSLDATFGLDEQAIAAARQWKFTPGMKDGVPVLVRVSIEMTFRIANARLAFPAAFDPLPSGAAPDEWPVERVTVGDLALTIPHPQSWRAADTQAPRSLFVMSTRNGFRRIQVFEPQAAAATVPLPLQAPQLAQFVDRLKTLPGILPNGTEIVGSGQATVANRAAIWIEIHAPHDAVAGALSAYGNAVADAIDSMDGWLFFVTSGSQRFTIASLVFHPAGLSAADRQADSNAAGAEFAPIITRLSLAPR